MTIKHLYLFLFALIACSCIGNKETYTSPKGYELTQPEKFILPNVLKEISGIAFNKGNSDSIYAEQDEEGKLFHFKLGNDNLASTKFAKKGDYEDIAICNGTVIMLRSDGTLFSFPLSETANQQAINVQEWKSLLPAGEYESLAADEQNNLLYILCKHCDLDKGNKQASGYILQLANNSINQHGNFAIDTKAIEKLSGKNKNGFHPSALARNSFTNEWYVLSSVNKLLVVTDANWTVKETHPLNPSLFNQPEGMAFDKEGNLYISNEGGEGNGNVLKFKRKENDSPRRH
jgi:uncharacterized protein YjiK